MKLSFRSKLFYGGGDFAINIMWQLTVFYLLFFYTDIFGLSPAISIQQKSVSKNPRSTVGTITEIYDYLRLLYARIGSPICPDHNEELSAKTVSEICDEIYALGYDKKIMVMAPVIRGKKGEHLGIYEDLKTEGFVRVKINGQLEILELRLDDDSLKEDKEVVEDLIISAVNKGIADAQASAKEKMNSVTGGMLSGLNIPGL